MPDYRQTEVNGLMQAMCPFCSKMYPMEEQSGQNKTPVDVPNRCKRCTSPMALGKDATEFSEARAKAEHDPNLAAVGKRLRGETPTPVTA